MRIVRSMVRRVVRRMAAWRVIGPQMAAMWLHWCATGRRANLRHPRDLNEKLMWLEFNTDTTLWSKLSDKIAVCDYVRGKGLEEILIPLIATYDSAKEIDLESLPDSFAIKSNHGTAQTLLVHDKSRIDGDKLRKRAAAWLKSDFAWASAEPHYTRIRPRLLVQELLPSEEGELPVDYKFMCFDGVPRYCLVCYHRDPQTFHSLISLFSIPDWGKMSACVVEEERGDPDLPTPANLERMIEYACRLSEGFPFVRVDFFEVGGKVKFGEMTFTPAAARNTSFSREFMLEMGSALSHKSGL